MNIPMTMSAGSSTIVMNSPRNTSVDTRAVGNMIRYAASTPAIAPEAPTIGDGETRPCPIAATMPQQVEDQVRRAPEAVFDVIAEDPEIEHVPENVQPAA